MFRVKLYKQEIARLQAQVEFLSAQLERRDDMMLSILDPSAYHAFKRSQAALRTPLTLTEEQKKKQEEYYQKQAQDAEELSDLITQTSESPGLGHGV